jgi:hypothetical protein
MQGLNDRWWPRQNEWTTSPARIQELLNEGELDWLSLTSITDDQWDNFTTWVSSHLINILDWDGTITNATAVKGEGPHFDEKTWSSRKETIVPTTLDFELKVEWVQSPRLTKILNAAAERVVAETERQLALPAAGRVPADPMQTTEPGGHVERTIYTGKPQASGKKRFRQSIEEPLLYTLYLQKPRTGFPKDAPLYVFPNSASPNKVPEGYVVVGGADMPGYRAILSAQNLVLLPGDEYATPRKPNACEVLLARAADLEDAT